MTNHEKLTALGLIASETQLSSDELAALEAMSENEIAMITRTQTKVREQSQEPRIPTFHVGV